jgi:hypothetical protein
MMTYQPPLMLDISALAGEGGCTQDWGGDEGIQYFKYSTGLLQKQKRRLLVKKRGKQRKQLAQVPQFKVNI